MLNRRCFLFASGASAFLPMLTGAARVEVGGGYTLTAATSNAELYPEAPLTRIWGYNGGVPGPLLRVRQGERLKVQLQNDLEQPTTLHWHGIRIENAMDGVAMLTQKPVQPGESFIYDFVVPDAGSYWYHPHNRSWEQVARGLYGGLIVEEAEPPAVDQDLALLIDDWRLGEDGQITDDFGSMMDWSHAGRGGNIPTVNGVFQPALPVRHNERLRLRLMNVCNATVMDLRLAGLAGTIVAYDGQPLPEVQPLDGGLVMAPGQRVDIIADVTAPNGKEAALLWAGGQEDFAFARFPVEGGVRIKIPGEIAPLPANPLPPSLELNDPVRTELVMSGGAMGGLRQARIGAHPMMQKMGHDPAMAGGILDIGGLVEQNLVWSFNEIAGMPMEPLLSVKEGQVAVIRIVNDTAWPHAMHLHGHHFRQISRNNMSLAPQPWRDTLLMEPEEVSEIAFVADNPGDWMVHCHMLEHQAAGMMTWLRVG